jgi:tryptophan synthase alpha subunit
LIFDCQKERQQKLEKTFSPSNLSHQVIHQTNVKGLSYVHLENLMFLQTLPRPEKSSGLMAYYTEISKAYDLVFINIKTHKRSHETIVPDLPIDSAVLIRSKRSIGLGKTPITLDVCDREVPVIGIVMNEGV